LEAVIKFNKCMFYLLSITVGIIIKQKKNKKAELLMEVEVK